MRGMHESLVSALSVPRADAEPGRQLEPQDLNHHPAGEAHSASWAPRQSSGDGTNGNTVVNGVCPLQKADTLPQLVGQTGQPQQGARGMEKECIVT